MHSFALVVFFQHFKLVFTNLNNSSFGIYVHIPFCRQKCPYCDFNSYPISASPISQSDYISALCIEIESHLKKPRWQNRQVHSLYLGGGTPTSLSLKHLSNLLSCIKSYCNLSSCAEITIEANPDTLIAETSLFNAKKYLEMGINRVSLGVQSFNNKKLNWLQRTHNAKDCKDAIKTLKTAGFENISIDLIFGLPNETIKEWEKDLSTAIAQDVSHISSYCLSINNGCSYYNEYRKGKLNLATENSQSELFLLSRKILTSNGFEHYEISNFAKNNRYSIHNSSYWNNIDYLGLGAGAHSFITNKTTLKPKHSFGIRWSNIKDLRNYTQKLSNNHLPIDLLEKVNKQQSAMEFFLLKLRQNTGFSIQDFEHKFSSPLPDKIYNLLKSHIKQNLISCEHGHFVLSCKGLLLADTIIEELSINV